MQNVVSIALSKAERTDLDALRAELKDFSNSIVVPAKEAQLTLTKRLEELTTDVSKCAGLADIDRINAQTKSLQILLGKKADTELVTQYIDHTHALEEVTRRGATADADSRQQLAELVAALKKGPNLERLSCLLEGLTDGMTRTIDVKVEERMKVHAARPTLVKPINASVQTLLERIEDVQGQVEQRLTEMSKHQGPEKTGARIELIASQLQKLNEVVAEKADRTLTYDLIQQKADKANLDQAVLELNLKADKSTTDQYFESIGEKINEQVWQQTSSKVDATEVSNIIERSLTAKSTELGKVAKLDQQAVLATIQNRTEEIKKEAFEKADGLGFEVEKLTAMLPHLRHQTTDIQSQMDALKDILNNKAEKEAVARLKSEVMILSDTTIGRNAPTRQMSAVEVLASATKIHVAPRPQSASRTRLRERSNG